MKLLQDDSLIRRAAAQDAAAFEQLMLLHQKPVYNICWRMAGNAEDALDLSQEVFLKLWRTLAQYQFDAAFSTWLYRMTQPQDRLNQVAVLAIWGLWGFSDVVVDKRFWSRMVKGLRPCTHLSVLSLPRLRRGSLPFTKPRAATPSEVP